MIEELFYLPWAHLASILAFFITAITLITMVGARWGPFRRNVGRMFQEMFGVAELRDALQTNTDSLEGYMDELRKSQETIVTRMEAMNTTLSKAVSDNAAAQAEIDRVKAYLEGQGGLRLGSMAAGQ